MKKELQEALFRDFPNLYRERTDKRKTNMAYGFCVGDGWEPIIRSLSQKLETMILALPEADRETHWCMQVKEKFGSLRFYMNDQTSEMVSLIQEAEDAAAFVCSTCGRSKKHTGMFMEPSCPGCFAASCNRKLADEAKNKL
jgi:hypothetical protein